jgi:hypothetical protein
MRYLVRTPFVESVWASIKCPGICRQMSSAVPGLRR